jgi:hypothetical protein
MQGVFLVTGLIQEQELSDIVQAISRDTRFQDKIRQSKDGVTDQRWATFPHVKKIKQRIVEEVQGKEGLFPGCKLKIQKWRIQSDPQHCHRHQDDKAYEGRLVIHLMYDSGDVRHVDFHDKNNGRLVAELKLNPTTAEVSGAAQST